MVVLSIANGVLSVLTRMMQSLQVQVMMFYIAIVSSILIWIGLIIEWQVKGGPLRIANYTGE